MDQWEYELWCNYNHEHVDEHGNWVSDEEEDEEYDKTKSIYNFQR